MSILKLKDSQGNWIGVPTIKGDRGNGISSAVLNNDYTLTLTFTDGTTYTTPSIRGEKGERGEPATDMEIYICSSNEYDSETRIPTITSPDDKTFYLVPTEDGTSPDLFTEWVYVNNAWEMFGSASVDLSGYLTDVTLNGNSVVTDGVAEIPIASTNALGLVKIDSGSAVGKKADGTLGVIPASISDIKTGIQNIYPITSGRQQYSTFYGLAKVAGHDEKDSELPVGQYTDEAKSSIQDMLDVPSNADLDEVEEKVEQNTEDLLKAFPVETASGSIASFEDGANGIPLQSLIVDINPVQDLHGQDAPYPAGGGLNKVPLFESKTVNGVTLTNNNGEITLNGTATADAYFDVDVSILVPNGSTFYLCCFNPVATDSRVSLFAITDNGNPQKNMNVVNGMTTTTATADTTISKIRLRAPIDVTLTDFKCSPMLQIGGTAPTVFSPYENICPISGWDGVNINVFVKNLFNYSHDEIKYNYYRDNNGDEVYSETSFYTTTSYPIQSNQNIVLLNENDGFAVRIYFLTEDSQWISRTNWLNTKSKMLKYSKDGIPANCKRIQLHFTTSNLPVLSTFILSSANTSINISWQSEAGTVYGGKLDVLSGVLTVDRAKYIESGQTNWIGGSAGNAWRWFADVFNPLAAIPTSQSELSKAMSDKFKATYTVWSDTQTTVGFLPRGTRLWIRFGADTELTTAQKVKEWFTTNPTEFVYELATPLTIQLTPNQVNSLLGVNNIWADTGDMALEYRADPDLYIQRKMPEVPVDDVQINGSSIVTDGVANVPIADANNKFGLIKIAGINGILVNSDGSIGTARALLADVKQGTSQTLTIAPVWQHASTFYGLAKAAGDTTQSQSSNAVGTYTEDAKSAISEMLNGSVAVSGTTPTIVAKSGIRYVCGEVATLDFTPSASGICDVVFTSGSTPTVVTLPSTVKFPDGSFVAEADTTYEINILDGIYGAVMAWT